MKNLIAPAAIIAAVISLFAAGVADAAPPSKKSDKPAVKAPAKPFGSPNEKGVQEVPEKPELVAPVKPDAAKPATAGQNNNKNAKPQAHPTKDRTHNRPIVVVPNRYVPVFQAWIDEPYVVYRWVLDPLTGNLVPVPVVYTYRRLVWVYLDRVTNTYGYFDRFGFPVPYVTRWSWGW